MKPVGPYSPFVKVGNLIFTSGQLPIESRTGNIVDGGIAGQTRQALENLQSIIQESGATLQDVVKINIYVTSLEEFPVINQIYQDFLGSHLPARTCIQVAKLPKDAKNP